MAAMTAATPEGLSYDEFRRKKLEENKRKLEELKLGHLSRSLREALPPKTSPAKPVKRRILKDAGPATPARRSGRVASLPPTNYREAAATFELVERRPRKLFKRRDLDGRVYASDEARLYAQTKAEEVQSELDTKFPSFVKPMLQSHTTGGFWLGLPRHFCSKYLPKRDTHFTLIDEEGEESDTLYLAEKNGLSAGWRGFAIAHDLVDGDALVFYLINATTFKVYITRASGYNSD